MNILIIKKNNLYSVIIDNNIISDVYIYRSFPIKFNITQYDIDYFLSNFCKLNNCYIQDCDVEKLVKYLEDFIVLQTNLFLLNQDVDHNILKEILTILNSSKKILTPIPISEPDIDIIGKFNYFLKNSIVFFEDNTSTITSTEIKKKFFKSIGIEERWNDQKFKKINNDINSALNLWERENNISTSITKGFKYYFKTFYGIGFKIEK